MSSPETVPIDPVKDKDQIHRQIETLRSIPQPTQRTPEWYLARYNLLTASNIYKAIGTPAQMNSLIYEKCQPMKSIAEELVPEDDVKIISLAPTVNLKSPLHWGKKYEPLTILLYEKLYDTKVEEFGCIPHEKHSFLGASPDGINVNPSSDRYGRLLEIKNVVSREITGIPKKEYMAQMQLQMEVCNLDLCDFVETKFIEFDQYQEWLVALQQKMETDDAGELPLGGVIAMFNECHGDGSGSGGGGGFVPKYEYMPLNTELNGDEMREWKMQTGKKAGFVCFSYWLLDVFSCVEVARDRAWFDGHLPAFRHVWETIEYERVHGYEHRAPKRRTRTKKEQPSEENSSMPAPVCILTKWKTFSS